MFSVLHPHVSSLPLVHLWYFERELSCPVLLLIYFIRQDVTWQAVVSPKMAFGPITRKFVIIV